MSLCDGCIHDDVCGLEDNHEEGIVSCAYRIPKNVLDKIKAEICKSWHKHPKNRYEEGLKDQALKDMQIIDKYREGEE